MGKPLKGGRESLPEEEGIDIFSGLIEKVIERQSRDALTREMREFNSTMRNLVRTSASEVLKRGPVINGGAYAPW